MNNVNSSKNRFLLLTGFMCSGKTYLGKLAAQTFGLTFVDADACIEKCELKSIPEIFLEKGEEYFRNIETKYFKDIIKTPGKGLIIASGGGFPNKEENRLLMKKGISIFVNTDIELILDRLNSEEKQKRPLLKNIDNKEIKKLYEKRLTLYKSTADYIVNNETELMALIKSLIKADENE